MRNFILILFFSLRLFGYSHADITNSVAYVATNEGVKPEILYTIVKIESDFNPFAISFLTNKANADYFATLSSPNARIRTSNYSLNRSKWVVAIHPINEAYAIQIAKELYEDGFPIDVGLGQLNAVNFDKSEIDYIFNPVYNLTKCAKILRKCWNAKNKNIKDTIECYNYGMRKRYSNPYYKRFYEHYEKMFGKPY
ncbi:MULTISPECIES: transglycosylase SLT domain-containing protein [unclassified Campylobacter]|uniref:transglycosylase SLT domain-containing protein n=1 Tax=unclassified Campylobacter TaxID=2593542 RepID=UPI0022E9AE4B|nr:MULTISPECIES: transglycosylase SLT domain-containing protein [unclassified Campylobacter]MDA3043746.1 transglycosylase SLT domain-containing protein [Campylobacter sp. JMF_09 ED2]MDA3045303.1 transglycosylase SLT domain-containing protein [Campylobacter sp. JMF_07 ED4]MDA3062076.1 transglycosylase SLT domain-containing protein [Campylobacter sp. JMF_14 EL1]MDA3064489.1 transglycosylase SLT domain-containing protein [Campylobacter sp. JMF_11 EL3]MDA3072182.1 transglycosylase SLT domain-conta